jgi:hypothetical protein
VVVNTYQSIAHFGGWRSISISSGTAYWGDPRVRVLEVMSDAGAATPHPVIQLPEFDSRLMQSGLTYTVINRNEPTLTAGPIRVVDPNGTLDVTFDEGASGEGHYRQFVWNGEWKLTGGSISSFTDNAGSVKYGPAIAEHFYDITVSSDMANINVYDEAVKRGYAGEDNTVVRLTITPFTVVGSAAPSFGSDYTFKDVGYSFAKAAISSGDQSNWGSGCSIMVDVEKDARVMGWGGRGGDGATPGTPADDGERGGCAIESEIEITVNNSGFVTAGSGGGGGGNLVLSASYSNAGWGGSGAHGGNMRIDGVLIDTEAGKGGADPSNFSVPSESGYHGTTLSTGGQKTQPSTNEYYVGGAAGKWAGVGSDGNGGGSNGVGGVNGDTVRALTGVNVYLNTLGGAWGNDGNTNKAASTLAPTVVRF